MKKFRFHNLSIPHTIPDDNYTACAYQQKTRKLSKMLTERGHEVIYYGHERSDVVCTELVAVTDDAVLRQAYGDFDYKTAQFQHSVDDYANQEFIRRTIPELIKRANPGDFLLCNWGIGHEPIARIARDLGVIITEPGVGYSSGHIPGSWRAYESHAIRTRVETAEPQNWYSRVIPNYFDPEDFEYRENKQPWVLYLGRVTELKGITTCIRATAHAGVELKIAGQGNLRDLGYERIPDHVEFLGYADRELRRGLMSRASALIIASTYLEPFGGVQVEALLSGTPIITPGFGAFAEVNQHEKTGFHCWTMRDFVHAINRRGEIDPQDCRDHGLKYTINAVAPEFERWFQDISEVYNGAGWSAV